MPQQISPSPRAEPSLPPNCTPPSKLERYFAQHEFDTPLLACCSDVEALTVAELLEVTSASAPSSTPSPSSSFLDAVSLGYVDPRGSPELRALVAREHGGGKITADDVVVAAPQELAYLVQRALLQEGDAVVSPWPVYAGLTSVAEAVGATVVSWLPRWEVDAGSETRRPRFDVGVDLRRCLDEASSRAAAAARRAGSDGRPPALRLVVLNFPHNPTGCTLTRDDFELALRISAVERGAHVLSDEMYRGVESGRETLPTAAEASLSLPPRLSGNVVSLGGLSKWGGCPGLRIGWLVTKDDGLLTAVSTLRDHTSICNSSVSEALAVSALGVPRLLRERARGIVGRNVAAATAFFSPSSDNGGGFGDLFDFYAPDASPVCLPRLRVDRSRDGGTGTDDESFCARAREEAGVLLLPASTFLSTRGGGEEAETLRGRFRLGLGRENLPEALEALRPLLERMRRERRGR